VAGGGGKPLIGGPAGYRRARAFQCSRSISCNPGGWPGHTKARSIFAACQTATATSSLELKAIVQRSNGEFRPWAPAAVHRSWGRGRTLNGLRLDRGGIVSTIRWCPSFREVGPGALFGGNRSFCAPGLCGTSFFRDWRRAKPAVFFSRHPAIRSILRAALFVPNPALAPGRFLLPLFRVCRRSNGIGLLEREKHSGSRVFRGTDANTTVWADIGA